MRASQFVGRVGGLAVVFGVGATAFAGATGVAWADDGGAGVRQSSDSPSGSSTRVNRANRGASGTEASGGGNRRVAPSAATTSVVPQLSSGAVRTISRLAGSAPAPSAAVDTVAAPSAHDVVPTPVTARAGAVSGLRAAAAAATSTGTGADSVVPLGTPLAWALLGAARRPQAAAAGAGAGALATAAAVTENGITYDTFVTFLNGVIQGNLNAGSVAGNDLVFTFVGSSAGGKLDLGNVPDPVPFAGEGSFTALPYATWINPANPTTNPVPTGSQTFNVRISEVSQFDKFITGLPLVGLVAAPIIGLLQQTPLIGSLLAPIIGGSVVAPIVVDLAAEVPAGQNVAFTYKVPSFDGTLISTNFFPALADAQLPGNFAATLLNGPGLGGAGATDPYASNQTAGTVPGLLVLRGGLQAQSGFNVITWDPRGEFASGGILQLDNPNYEGRDVSALITWATANTPAIAPDGDPLLGMIGGSYGGGIQMTASDNRIDAIVPTIAWNSLTESLYPTNVFKTGWANILALALLEAGARVNNQIWRGIISGDVFGWLSQSSQAVLASSGTTPLMEKLDIPTLFVQGTVDALFPLAQAVQNAEILAANGLDPDARMIWFCGGHGVCLDQTLAQQTAQNTQIFTYDMAWLNKYVKGAPVDQFLPPTFSWWDQLGDDYSSDYMPFDTANFNGVPIVGVNAAGGGLGILPFAIGGSGPYAGGSAGCPNGACSFPLNQVIATKSQSAVEVVVDTTVDGFIVGRQIVGAPTISFDYSGLGTSRAVYAQIVDNQTGRVLGNIATPIPLVLNGRPQTIVDFPIADIAYTAAIRAGAQPSLTVQIVPTSNLYWNSSWGSVNISNVSVTLPTVGGGQT